MIFLGFLLPPMSRGDFNSTEMGFFFFLASSLLGVVFRHVGRSVNGFADSLAKHGVERTRDLRI